VSFSAVIHVEDAERIIYELEYLENKKLYFGPRSRCGYLISQNRIKVRVNKARHDIINYWKQTQILRGRIVSTQEDAMQMVRQI